MRPFAELQALVNGISLIGRANSARAIRYALRRDRLDKALPPAPTQPQRGPGGLTAVEPVPGGLTARFEHGVLEVRALAPDLVSVGWDGALDQPSYAVEAWSGSPPPTETVHTAEGWWLRTGTVTVTVAADATLTWRNAAGVVVRVDRPPRWEGRSWTLRTVLGADATVHGLGGRGHGWNLRPGTYRCWNADPGGAWRAASDPLYVTTPAYVVLDDAGAVHCFHDDTFEGAVEVGDEVVVTFTDGPLRYHVAVGSLPGVLDRYTALTGRPALPPRWALGYHHARWGWRTSAEVREVWQGFRQHDCPISALHLDIDHFDRCRDFTVDAERYGDLPALAAELAADDVRLVSIVDAAIVRADDDATFRSGDTIGAWCTQPDGQPMEGVVWPGPTVFPDFTDPAVRTWWGRQYARSLATGFAGFWQDMNEPSSFAAWGELTLPRSTRHHLDGRGGDHREAHNVYGLLMNRAAYEGLRELRPERRPFLFSRSGWAGQQRYGGHWTGDIVTSWAELRASLAFSLGLAMSGVPYSGPDIGGFTSMPDAELYVRWFELGSWLPLFRTHGSLLTGPREPWRWDTRSCDALRQVLRRRYRLLPFWYTLAHEVSASGAPYVRPLAWLDPRLRTVDDTVLVGESVLVAPVLGAGARTRRVTLPDGAWVDARSGERFEGGPHTVAAPLGDTPWFVRAGAVVPTEEDGRLVLLVAAPERQAAGPGGSLWTDDGDGWHDGRCETYAVRDGSDGLVVERTVEQDGPFPWSGVEARTLDGRPLRVV